ncbi:MAG TPA: orotate phosphoribosyltransferase [Candidatus Kapabacteria bacterium]|jgi:orotate phosphoribosyltransferase
MTIEQEAIEFFLREEVLKFGDFTLKSGRKSPYFFNTGSLCTAAQLKKMGELYAQKLLAEATFQNADVIFGSAYKGIPISVATTIALSGSRPGIRAVSDRKEAKTHGDKSSFLGTLNPGDRVAIVDDVIATGGTKMEAVAKLREAGAIPVGLIIAFDRAEPAEGSTRTAKENFEKETGLPVFALANIHDVIAHRPEVRNTFEAYLATLK